MQQQRHIHHNLRLHRASRYIILASLVLSVIAVFFVANSNKRPHSNASKLYELDEVQKWFMEKIKKLLVERHKQKEYELKRRFNPTPVSAHISLAVPTRIPGYEDKPDPYFKKDYNMCVRINMNSFNHARGVIADDDGLIILQSGMYIVFASVTPEYSSNFAYLFWSHYIYKMRPNSQARSIKLTETFHTFLNWTNSQNTGYSAGVFYLETGEKIQLCLTGQGLIACDERSNFLGLFMLTNSSRY